MVPHGEGPERRLRICERLFHFHRILKQPDRVIIVLAARCKLSCQNPLSNLEKCPLSLVFCRTIAADLFRETSQDHVFTLRSRESTRRNEGEPSTQPPHSIQ